MRPFLFFVFILCCIEVQAIPVFHQIRPGSTFTTLSMANSCITLSDPSYHNNCNPSLLHRTAEDGIAIFALGKSDGSSIEMSKKLIFDPISKSTLEELFDHNNYNSFSLNSSIDFISSLFKLSYSPYFLIGDVFVYNPSFPEVSLFLANRSTLSISSSVELINNSFFTLSGGATVSYYKHSQSKDNFSLASLASTPVDELVVFSEDSGVIADLNFFLELGKYFPQFSLQLKNIGSKYKVSSERKNSAVDLEPILLFETYILTGVGYNIKLPVGHFYAGFTIPYDGFFEKMYTDLISGSARYSMGSIEFMIGAGQYHKNVGLYFRSPSTRIGIVYAREEELGDYYESQENSAYLSMEIKL